MILGSSGKFHSLNRLICRVITKKLLHQSQFFNNVVKWRNLNCLIDQLRTVAFVLVQYFPTFSLIWEIYWQQHRKKHLSKQILKNNMKKVN